MANIGDTVSFTASKYKNLFVSDDKRYTIAYFTVNARDARLYLPQDAKTKQYGTTHMFIVKGFIPDGIDNIAYELTGCWSIDKNRNQPYLDVQKANISIPTRKKSVVAFLRSNCKGIGNVKATAIANAFGENTLSVCANEPEKLKKMVPSLTDKDIKALKHGCQALTYKYDIRCFLDDKNIVLPDYQIDAIADEYGAEALNIIKGKPYKLITLLPFQTCDKIGLAMGVSPNARRRYVAALVEAQKQLCRQNNTVCVREDLLVAEAYKLLNHHNDELMKMSVKLLVDNYRFIRFGSSKSGNWIYSKEDFAVERNLARKLAAFIKRGPSKQKEIDAALAKWKKNSPIQLSEKQEEAVRNLAYPISIVTGGPGTGKSTTLRACLEVYKEAFKKDATILCMAPTGRASKRMAECTGLPAQTIHSACALVPSKAAGGFTAQDDCKISENLIAIDEMSMVGIHLFDFVMNAIENEPNKKIILLGDVDQLPSVTPGNVLFDLIKCNQIKYTVLDRNYRQGSNSTIADAAYAINNGMSNLPTDETFQFIDCHNPDSEKETEDISNIIIQKYQEGVKMPILEDLYNTMKDVPELRRVCNIFKPLISGSLSSFNNHTNVDLSNLYIVFDFDACDGKNKVMALFIVLDFCWSKIKEDSSKQKAIFIDEAWNLISKSSNEMCADFIKEIFKTIRAYNGAAFVMTQNASDFFTMNGGEYGRAIITNADTKIIMQLPETEIEILRTAVQLTDDECNKIQQLHRGSGLVIAGSSKLFADFTASDFEAEVISGDIKKSKR